MKNLILTLSLLMACACLAVADNFTMTTYYPAPNGRYSDLATTDITTSTLTASGNVTIGTLLVTHNVGIGSFDSGANLNVQGIARITNSLWLNTYTIDRDTGGTTGLGVHGPWNVIGGGITLSGAQTGVAIGSATPPGAGNLRAAGNAFIGGTSTLMGNVGVGGLDGSANLNVVGIARITDKIFLDTYTLDRDVDGVSGLGVTGPFYAQSGLTVRGGGVMVGVGAVPAAGRLTTTSDVVIGGNTRVTGCVGIGMAPDNLLSVAGTASFSDKIIIDTYTIDRDLGGVTGLGVTAPWYAQNGLTVSGGAMIGAGGLPGNGNLTATGTITAQAYLHSSDERLKQDITPVTNALDKVKAMNGVYFKFKKDPARTHLGLIAQNVEKVIPEVVITGADDMKSVEYANLVALLIEAVKEQQVMIDALRSDVAELKAQLPPKP